MRVDLRHGTFAISERGGAELTDADRATASWSNAGNSIPVDVRPVHVWRHPGEPAHWDIKRSPNGPLFATVMGTLGEHALKADLIFEASGPTLFVGGLSPEVLLGGVLVRAQCGDVMHTLDSTTPPSLLLFVADGAEIAPLGYELVRFSGVPPQATNQY